MLYQFPPSGPQRVNASCLELVLWNIFSTWLFKYFVFISFLKKKTPHLLLYILIVKQSLISPELLILVCECAFSFWFLLLYPQIIFVSPSRCLFSSFPPDSACPCILNDWNLILKVLVWQASCNDRTLSQYFVNLSLFLSTHVVVINITVGIAEMRTVLFPLFLSWDAGKWSNDTRHTAIVPCQFHKLLFVSVLQNRKGSARFSCVSASVWEKQIRRLEYEVLQMCANCITVSWY